MIKNEFEGFKNFVVYQYITSAWEYQEDWETTLKSNLKEKGWSFCIGNPELLIFAKTDHINELYYREYHRKRRCWVQYLHSQATPGYVLLDLLQKEKGNVASEEKIREEIDLSSVTIKADKKIHVSEFKCCPPPTTGEVKIKFPEICSMLLINAAEELTKPDISKEEFSFAVDINRACITYLLNKKYVNDQKTEK